jgi:hypothetical protein
VLRTVGESSKIQDVDSSYENQSEDTPQKSPEKDDGVTINRDSNGEVTSIQIESDSDEEAEIIELNSSPQEESEEVETDDEDLSAEDLVSRAAEEMTVSKDNLEEFLDRCFKEMVSEHQSNNGKDMSDFQSIASHVGSVFEAYFEYVVETLYSDVTVERDVELPESAMVGTGSADAVIYDSEDKETILSIVELKGNPQKYTNLSDEVIHTASCSGLQRSDTVKKAVCQGYQAKTGYPHTPFFVVSNTLPNEGTSPEKVLSFAEGDLIDEVVDITNSTQFQEILDSL